MTATVHLVLGPAGSGKTQRLLERNRALTPGGPGSGLWLGPTHRYLEALRARLVGEPLACLAPQLATFQDFADELIRCADPRARPLSGVQRRLLIDALLAELHTGGAIHHFRGVVETRGFAEGMFALLEELKGAGITPADFGRAAGVVGGDKTAECVRFYARYEERLRAHHLYDTEGRLAYAGDLLRRGVRRPFERVRAVFVDGFSDFRPTQLQILEALAGGVEELWIVLPDDEGEERAELFSGPRTIRRRLGPLAPLVEFATLPLGSAEVQEGLLPFEDRESPPQRPAGLAHLERQLFRPPRSVIASDDAAGLLLLEAPGMLGEARMAARQIKALLADGTPAEEVLVSVRDLSPYADLLREVFGEYGIPVDVEGTEPLTRCPAVATLLRALRLPDDDWPFAAVTALLRSSYFQPDWPETRADAEVAQHAEVLLRLLGEPRNRDAYREAVRRWAEDPPPGLEDEQAEESRRTRTHELAQRCRPFLERFFCAWDGAPQQATPGEHVAWLRRLAADLGIERQPPHPQPLSPAAGARGEIRAWQRFQEEIDQWLRLDGLLHAPRPLARKEFLRRVGSLAAQAGVARTPRGPGRVRILSAPLARTLTVDYLFVLGLGERSFPRLIPPDPLFDEAERQAFKQTGIPFPCVSDQMPDEMLLFYEIVTRARRRLVLGYPAVDAKGQPLLPSSFLNHVRDCFTPGAIPVERRSMLIEGYDRDEPLSPAEYRVQAARSLAAGATVPRSVLPADLVANLRAAARMAQQRFHKDFTVYDGRFRDPGVIAEVAELFGPEKVFSPTALEDYIACPFRFFLRHVLRLETLEEPTEEIEVTRRGQAFHRALSRLHLQLKAEGVVQPTAVVDQAVLRQLKAAVEEYVARAPSQASKMLWRLEGERLMRVGARYPGHWQKFLDPWKPVAVRPQPHWFEVDFGLRARPGETVFPPLVIRGDGVEVRISGRIDRVDIAELEQGVGFWIIDYKTGKSGYYTGKDLGEFRRLQLTLYALAVEQVLLADRPARPLGLAYWMVTEHGPKVALPGKGALMWFHETERWREVRERLQGWVTTLAAHIRQGVFALKPRSEHCTQTCDFSQVCRISQARQVVKGWELPLPGTESERRSLSPPGPPA